MEVALFTTPLPLHLLAADDRLCSICHEPYIEPPSHGCTQADQAGEWAVRIELVAESSSLRRCCGHVIGKQCLAAHLRSQGPWKRQCPLCRDVWFRNTNRPSRTSRRSGQSEALPDRGRATRSTALTTGNTNRDRSRSPLHERDEQQTSQENAPESFVQRVREKLQIQKGSDEVGRTLEEVEQTLRDLYGQPANPADPSE
jgi:hypothetical protein